MLCLKKTLIAFPRKESYAWQVARLVQENYLYGTPHILVILDDHNILSATFKKCRMQKVLTKIIFVPSILKWQQQPQW